MASEKFSDLLAESTSLGIQTGRRLANTYLMGRKGKPSPSAFAARQHWQLQVLEPTEAEQALQPVADRFASALRDLSDAELDAVAKSMVAAFIAGNVAEVTKILGPRPEA